MWTDMIKFNYPKSDRIFLPFVLNYLKDKKELTYFFKKIHLSLNKKGKIAGIIDTPKRKIHNMKSFGVIKKRIVGDLFYLTLALSIEVSIESCNRFYYPKESNYGRRYSSSLFSTSLISLRFHVSLKLNEYDTLLIDASSFLFSFRFPF